MLESEFESFLVGNKTITSKDKAVKTRISKARAVERELGCSLDYIVSSDEEMLCALKKINEVMKNSSGNYSNALRKYYLFKNKHEFPHIKSYETKRY